ncbi:MerR family transcriptional regulator [Actinomycetes bacterium M1A6_2h]
MVEYRIDDLARAASTTSRNVRAYQERGLLAPPLKRGRVGIYDDTHLSRLRLIDLLLQRGFTTTHIADFIHGWENGKDLAEVLGLQSALTEQWSSNNELAVPLDLVDGFLGAGNGDQLDRLVRLGLARIDGDTCVFTDPQLVEGFADLVQHGYTLPVLLDTHERLQRYVDAIAKDMIVTAKSQIVEEHGEGWLPDGDEVGRTADMLVKLREVGVKSVHSILAHALDDNLQRELGDYLSTALTKSTRDGASAS